MHCIPIDPHYLEWKAKELNFNTHFIALAGEINRKMPGFVREKALRILNRMGVAPSRANILVLGVAYKRDIADYRESPAIEVIRLLKQDGANVVYHDPYVPCFTEDGLSMESLPLTAEILAAQDLVIITTDHSSLDYAWVVACASAILDNRGATRSLRSDKVVLL